MVKDEFESLPLRPSTDILPGDVECYSNQRRRHSPRSFSSPRIYSSIHWAIHAICLTAIATLWYATYSTLRGRDGDCGLKHNVWCKNESAVTSSRGALTMNHAISSPPVLGRHVEYKVGQRPTPKPANEWLRSCRRFVGTFKAMTPTKGS